ncbi:MAG: hypothetical protein ACREXR_19130, partial [Gammaproteobacteria bacterium]
GAPYTLDFAEPVTCFTAANTPRRTRLSANILGSPVTNQEVARPGGCSPSLRHGKADTITWI